MEVWKNIEGYEGLYQVSNLGRVKGVFRGHWRTSHRGRYWVRVSEKILTNIYDRWYIKLVLSKNNVRKTFFVHRLVAKAFCPNPKGENYVNHISGVKLDNRAENLEWCSFKENYDHAVKNGLINVKGIKNGHAKLNNKQVMAIRKKYKTGGCSSYQLAKKYGIAASSIMDIVNRTSWKHL